VISRWWGGVELLVLWAVWWYPFVFRAPRVQKRPSITVSGPTRIGLLFEALSYAVAFFVQLPAAEIRGWPWLVAAALLGIVGILIFWTAIQHLGRQFRINAGLYEDHQLVRSGPYSVVRHPIYASMLAMLLATMLVLTPWAFWPLALALFVAGTEIRVRSEEALLASRFGAAFEEYRRSTSAYIPLLR
jgi:protein-S-isoprenylcysteine O-methyltransferase Ste14